MLTTDKQPDLIKTNLSQHQGSPHPIVPYDKWLISHRARWVWFQVSQVTHRFRWTYVVFPEYGSTFATVNFRSHGPSSFSDDIHSSSKRYFIKSYIYSLSGFYAIWSVSLMLLPAELALNNFGLPVRAKPPAQIWPWWEYEYLISFAKEVKSLLHQSRLFAFLI